MEKKDEEERGIDEMGMIVELDILGEFGLDRQCPTVAPAIERNQIFSPPRNLSKPPPYIPRVRLPPTGDQQAINSQDLPSVLTVANGSDSRR